MLSPRIVAAVSVPEDHAIDNRALLSALTTAIEKAGGEIREGIRVDRFDSDRQTPMVEAVMVASGERITIEASKLVIASGPWASDLEGWPNDQKPSIRPVKGPDPRIAHASPIRFAARGSWTEGLSRSPLGWALDCRRNQ